MSDEIVNESPVETPVAPAGPTPEEIVAAHKVIELAQAVDPVGTATIIHGAKLDGDSPVGGQALLPVAGNPAAEKTYLGADR